MARGRARVGESVDTIALARTAESADERVLVNALRRGDEDAFVALVERFQASLLRMANVYCADRSLAEEVVQETWLGVLHGIDRFEARSSLKTWIFSILVRRARTRARKEFRTVPFSAMAEGGAERSPESIPSPSSDLRFQDGRWQASPACWGPTAEERVFAGEIQVFLRGAIEALPSQQRAVLTLRDVEGWTSEDVCNVLHIAETNQRVLLHRARSKVRQALADYFV